MHVFVTGATGFVGSAVVQELIKAGHQVLGLARSDNNIEQLKKAGAEAHPGSLEDLESLKSGAASSDAVIHAGFIHDFSKFKENCELDRRVIEAIGSVLVGTNKPFIITSGIALLPSGQVSDENDNPFPGMNPRIATEEAANKVKESGVNVSLVRLPPSVHGEGDHGFVPMIINMAREKGVSAYIGEGNNRWSTVHRLDTAVLYRLALEKGISANYHAIAEEGIPFREIAEVIGKHLNIPVEGKTHDDAAQHFTWFLHFAGIDCPSSSKQTQEQLDWKPTQINLIEDINNSYF